MLIQRVRILFQALGILLIAVGFAKHAEASADDCRKEVYCYLGVCAADAGCPEVDCELGELDTCENMSLPTGEKWCQCGPTDQEACKPGYKDDGSGSLWSGGTWVCVSAMCDNQNGCEAGAPSWVWSPQRNAYILSSCPDCK
jgi:hypothetical protein